MYISNIIGLIAVAMGLIYGPISALHNMIKNKRGHTLCIINKFHGVKAYIIIEINNNCIGVYPVYK